MPKIDETRAFIPVGIAVVTLSDTRTLENDKSGDLLVERLTTLGHTLAARHIVPDDFDTITQTLTQLIDDPEVSVILTTGGTGITGRDVTPEACEALFTKPIPGFGELFRMISYDIIGTSTIQSRATAGLAGDTLIFALPGSTGACKDAWDNILITQLDSRFRPCNFIELMPRFGEQ